MSLLDLVTGTRKRVKKKAAKRRVEQKAARNAELRKAERRRRRIEAGEPANRREAAIVAKRELKGLGGDVAELAQTAPGAGAAGAAKQKGADAVQQAAIRARVRRAIKERRKAEIQAEESGRSVLDRAQDLATAGPVIDGAELDPAGDGFGTVEELAMGLGVDPEDPGGDGGFPGMMALLEGGVDVDDPDRGSTERIDRDPLEFDDPFGLTGGK